MLHRMNPVRVQYVLDKLREVQLDEDESEGMTYRGHALSGLDVLDVGCGGGLMSEVRIMQLQRLHHAQIVPSGRASLGSVRTQLVWMLPHPTSPLHPCMPLRIRSSQTTVNDGCSIDMLRLKTSYQSRRGLTWFAAWKCWSMWTTLPNFYVPAVISSRCVFAVALVLQANDPSQPGGNIFLSTIARTPLSYFLTIFMAEKVLGNVAPGTHTYDKFINSSELMAFFREEMRWFDGTPGRLEAEVRGMMYLPWEGRWKLLGREKFGAAECNYMFWAKKPRA